MKLELGGGTRNRGDGWHNADLDPAADTVCDLDVEWPFPDDSVSEVYSSHCIEHVKDPTFFIREVCRVAKLGAPVEIRCPDPMSEMAMCGGHRSVVSPTQMERHTNEFPELWFSGPKRLTWLRTDRGPDPYYWPKARASPALARWSDEEIMLWVPRTVHENCFHFVVSRNE